MDTLELVAPCNFAVESILSREIKNLGYEVTEVTDGRVTLLFSTSDMQSIVKKAVVESLKAKYKVQRFEESGERYPIHVFINKDRVSLYLDTSGLSLHKRGYREVGSAAPIKETLAAAMILLTPWKKDRTLIDPLCGSGTIPIEAAMIGLNMAPGMNRSFVSEKWRWVPGKFWSKAREEAVRLLAKDGELNVQGYDIDEVVLRIARRNAAIAGLEGKIHFQCRDVKDLSSKDHYGFIITNPPYGERLSDLKAVEGLYRDMGEVFSKLETWSFYIISSHEEFERFFGRRADKKRKLYNGMMRTDFYQFFGPKPPKRTERKEE